MFQRIGGCISQWVWAADIADCGNADPMDGCRGRYQKIANEAFPLRYILSHVGIRYDSCYGDQTSAKTPWIWSKQELVLCNRCKGFAPYFKVPENIPLTVLTVIPLVNNFFAAKSPWMGGKRFKRCGKYLLLCIDSCERPLCSIFIFLLSLLRNVRCRAVFVLWRVVFLVKVSTWRKSYETVTASRCSHVCHWWEIAE